MRIIITGGTGLIGIALAESLVADGHEVIVLSRHPHKANLPNGVKAQAWDGKSGEGWVALLNADTAIVNLAGETLSKRWTAKRKEDIRKSRVQAGQAVTSAIESAAEKPRVLIQASAVGYYGPRGNEEITEHSAPGNDFLAGVCKDWEATTESVGIRRAVIRTGIVLSMKGGAFPPLLRPIKLFVGGPLGSGKQWFPWIHIKDEVKAIRFLIDHESANGVFNLSAPHPLTNGQFTHLTGKVVHRPAVMPIPGIAMKILFGEMSTLLLDGQRMVPNRLLNQGFEFGFPDAERALRDLLGK